MPVYKDKKTGKWFAMTCYTNVYGERKQKCKRGFKTRSEALEWEREFALTDDGKPDMLFKTFVDIYLSEIKPRIKENTYLTKESKNRKNISPELKQTVELLINTLDGMKGEQISE